MDEKSTAAIVDLAANLRDPKATVTLVGGDDATLMVARALDIAAKFGAHDETLTSNQRRLLGVMADAGTVERIIYDCAERIAYCVTCAAGVRDIVITDNEMQGLIDRGLIVRKYADLPGTYILAP